MKIVLVTDAWKPQVNGVVRTLTTTVSELERLGHQVVVVEPSLFRSFPCPLYPEIPIVYGVKNAPNFIQPPCAIHIATEGALGIAYNFHCRRNNIPFTTSYTTNYPDYFRRYAHIPESLTYRFLRWFHRGSHWAFTATPSLDDKLASRGFNRLRRWSRGVDTALFHPRPKSKRGKKYLIYVGRVAVEKNIEAFLDVQIDGVQKIVVGDGPHLKTLRNKYRDTVFHGALSGEPLAEAYASADCFVFPSRSDTFGLVILEALASGLPVAAYPVEGPRDIWDKDPRTGCLHDDLAVAIRRALEFGQPEACRQLALRYRWEDCARQFADSLVEYGANDRLQ
jgi:1,2-diacylglycerol 3-alpha-glucosyltransferase/glucuronosyltransferase